MLDTPDQQGFGLGVPAAQEAGNNGVLRPPPVAPTSRYRVFQTGEPLKPAGLSHLIAARRASAAVPFVAWIT